MPSLRSVAKADVAELTASLDSAVDQEKAHHLVIVSTNKVLSTTQFKQMFYSRGDDFFQIANVYECPDSCNSVHSSVWGIDCQDPHDPLTAGDTSLEVMGGNRLLTGNATSGYSLKPQNCFNFNKLGGRENDPDGCAWAYSYVADQSRNFYAQHEVMGYLEKDTCVKRDFWTACSRMSIEDQLYGLAFASETDQDLCMAVTCARRWSEVEDALAESCTAADRMIDQFDKFEAPTWTTGTTSTSTILAAAEGTGAGVGPMYSTVAVVVGAAPNGVPPTLSAGGGAAAVTVVGNTVQVVMNGQAAAFTASVGWLNANLTDTSQYSVSVQCTVAVAGGNTNVAGIASSPAATLADVLTTGGTTFATGGTDTHLAVAYALNGVGDLTVTLQPDGATNTAGTFIITLLEKEQSIPAITAAADAPHGASSTDAFHSNGATPYPLSVIMNGQIAASVSTVKYPVGSLDGTYKYTLTVQRVGSGTGTMGAVDVKAVSTLGTQTVSYAAGGSAQASSVPLLPYGSHGNGDITVTLTVGGADLLNPTGGSYELVLIEHPLATAVVPESKDHCVDLFINVRVTNGHPKALDTILRVRFTVSYTFHEPSALHTWNTRSSVAASGVIQSGVVGDAPEGGKLIAEDTSVVTE